MNMESTGGTSDRSRPANAREQALLQIEKRCADFKNTLEALRLSGDLEIVIGQMKGFRGPRGAAYAHLRKGISHEIINEGVLSVGAFIAGIESGMRESDLLKRESVRITTDTGTIMPFAYGTELYINPDIEELLDAEVAHNSDPDSHMSPEEYVEAFVDRYKEKRQEAVHVGQGSSPTRH